MTRWHRTFAIVATLLAMPATLTAQFTEAPPPAAYALEGVTVVSADGARDEGVNVIIRGGIIEAIGTGIPIPEDARLLEGDSLFVYPGIIDAAGKVEYKFPELEINWSEIGSWNPPRDVQSFMPHRRVVDYVSATGSDVADSRKAGIVAAAVHAEGRLMPGQGTLVILRQDAETPADLVVRPTLGLSVSFQGAQRVYPSRLFAVMAFYRQSFEDARHLAARQEAYDRGRDGVTAPGWDPDLAVLQQAMSGEIPVYFRADLGRDIQRVLELAREYSFQPVIVGGEGAWEVADELKAANVPVLVSLDFPKPDRWKPDEKKAESEPTPGVENGSDAGAEDPELDAGALREKERIENAYSNPGRLAASGVTFALTSGGGKAKILENTRKAIEYGLGEEDALTALTATPAGLLGIERVARIEVGGPATFIVADKALFEDGSRVVYTFVEGGFVKGADKKSAAGGDAPAVNVAGVWEVTTESEMGTRTGRLTLSQDGNTLTGTMSGDFGEASISDGNISGSEIVFTYSMTIGDNTIEIEYTGTVSGDEMSGEGNTRFGGFTWKAKKTGPGEEIGR